MVELAENLDTFHPNLVHFFPILAFQMLYNFAQNLSKLRSKCGAKIPKKNIGNTRIIPNFFTKFRHVFLTILTSKSDSTRISVEIFISKFHPNFASEYRKKCGPHSTRFQCRRHYVADIFCQKMSPKMSPTFKKCRRHLHRHFRRNYQNIGWVHR